MTTSFSQTVFDVVRITSPDLAIEAEVEADTANIHTLARNPLQIWIVQAAVIMITTQVLSLPLKKIRQPRVIAEVLGGIVLSPSALGRIPGFTQAIFPSASKPYLVLVANIGLVLFMFLIGLEIDGRLIRRNARLSALIALSGMIIPFVLGAAFSIALYKQFINPDTEFTHFLLFVGVAFSITAFPVLCRILTELKLLDTTVGVVVLSAGVANDVIGWTLLAFSMALAKAASGLSALWVLLACLGWTLLLLFPVRKMFHWLARRTGSIKTGPTMFFMTITMFMMLCSALVTDTIGIHAIFGSFLAGLIIPREGGLANALTKRLEDIVSIIFLPLYFTASGLSTDFSLLNDSIIWMYTISIISIAWVGKFGGCTIAARISGFQWREAMSIGTLMSCKGLVELIVLNVGLSAGILNTRVYTMFVLEALLLTFSTTPAVAALYPPEYRKRAVIAGPEYNSIIDQNDTPKDAILHKTSLSRLTVILDKLEHLPGTINMMQLFRPFVLQMSQRDSADSDQSDSSLEQGRILPSTPTPPSSTIQALRLFELFERTQAIKSSTSDSLIHTDLLLNLFTTFCNMNNIPVSISLSAVSIDNVATTVLNHMREKLSDMVLVPWLPLHVSSGDSPDYPYTSGKHLTSDAEMSNRRSTTPIDTLNSVIAVDPSPALYSRFLRGIFTQSSVNVALFMALDRGHTKPQDYRHQRIVLPFFGGPDDRLALTIVMQMCRNPETTAKVIRIARHSCADEEHVTEVGYSSVNDGQGKSVVSDVEQGGHTTNPVTPTSVLQSNAADNILWQHFATCSFLQPSGTRTAIDFIELEPPTPLREVVARVKREIDIAVEEKFRPFIITGRARSRTELHFTELDGLLDSEGHSALAPEVRETIGDVATAFTVADKAAGVFVVQSVGI